MKIPQTERDLMAHLKEQMGFLVRSSHSYDEGIKVEAKRLAVTIRVLVYDKGDSKSLLRQLNRKDILFYDTASDCDLNNPIPQSGLTFTKYSFGSKNESIGEYVPKLDDGRIVKRVEFDEWWNKIVIIDKYRKRFSRGDLVRALANQDGGAHVDPGLKEDYANLSRSNSLGWKIFIGDSPAKDFENGPELPSVRQIAYEVIKSLSYGFRDYLSP